MNYPKNCPFCNNVMVLKDSTADAYVCNSGLSRHFRYSIEAKFIEFYIDGFYVLIQPENTIFYEFKGLDYFEIFKIDSSLSIEDGIKFLPKLKICSIFK